MQRESYGTLGIPVLAYAAPSRVHVILLAVLDHLEAVELRLVSEHMLRTMQGTPVRTYLVSVLRYVRLIERNVVDNAVTVNIDLGRCDARR